MTYDLIIIGTPVWMSTYTPAIKSFLQNNLISNKKIALFCSHEGGAGETLINLQKELVGNEILGVMDFLAPLKKDKTAALDKAKTWAVSLAKL